MIQNDHWYCPYCKEKVDPRNVTNEERHELCLHSVEWVVHDGNDRMCLTRPQNDFYNLSGSKPILVDQNKKVTFANPNYVSWLEKFYKENCKQ